MKTLCKRLYACKLLIVLLIIGLIVCSLSACKGKKGEELSSQVSSDKSNTSSTVSIYYKDDEPSDIVYDDIITDGDTEPNASLSDNLASDAKPQLIIPSDKTYGESSKSSGTSSENVSHQDNATSSGSTVSKDNETASKTNSSSKNQPTASQAVPSNNSQADSSNASQVVSSQNTESNPESSITSSSGDKDDTSSKEEATSSYDKGYTKPY